MSSSTRAGPDAAVAVLGHARARRDVPLAPLTTYRVGGAAAVFVNADGVGDLARVGEAADVSGLPVLVVGRGSNMLVADEGFAGIAVVLGAFANSIQFKAGAAVAGAGVALPVLARRTVAAGLTGFEWAVGVPGSVGGAVRMNAGGHGSDMASSTVTAEVFDMATGATRRLASDEIGYRFRASALTDRDVVVAVTLALGPGDRATGEAELAEIVRWRREHQPGGQNCGSVFVNPVPGEVSAGALIDQLGLRGLRIGTAQVSLKHANFIQADEGGRAGDVVAVMRRVSRAVREEFGYDLRSEVRLVGFDDG